MSRLKVEFFRVTKRDIQLSAFDCYSTWVKYFVTLWWWNKAHTEFVVYEWGRISEGVKNDLVINSHTDFWFCS